MRRLAMLVLALAVIAGCKAETAREADRAADEVKEERSDFERAQHTGPLEAPHAIATEGRELAQAEAKYEDRRRVRVDTLRAEHAIIASQSTLISTMAQNFPLTDQGRAEINEKLTRFQMRLDETKNLIEGLSAADPDVWDKRHDAVRDAMNKLEEAREDAWEALEEAPKVDRRAS